jgi:N-acetylglucosaminyl-diphospho-decaprenol L-rhamnosyltransferase
VPISDEAHPIGWVSGALMIIRKQVLDDVGTMDEGFFLYYEETDFTLRAKRAGWDCWHVPQSRIVHYVGHSVGVTLRTDHPARRPRFWFESRHRFFVKNYGFLYALLTDTLAISALSIWRLRRFVQRKPDTDPPHLLRDLIRNSVFFRGWRLNTPEQARPDSSS